MMVILLMYQGTPPQMVSQFRGMTYIEPSIMRAVVKHNRETLEVQTYFQKNSDSSLREILEASFDPTPM